MQHSLSTYKAQSAVIGYLLRNPLEVESFPLPASLLSEPYASILAAMRRMAEHHIGIDLFTLLEVLQTEGADIRFDDLTEIHSSACTAQTVGVWTDRVREYGRLTRIAMACHRIAGRAAGSEYSADALLAQLQDVVNGDDAESGQEEFIPVNEIAKHALAAIEKRIESDGQPEGLQTDLIDLDHAIGGLRGGEMIVIAGRPGMGKTALAMAIANHVSLSVPVAVFALEMGELQTSYRLLSSLSGVGMRRLTREMPDESDFSALSLAVSKISRMKQHWSFADNPSVSRIRAMCQRLKRKHGLGMIVVDYLQLMDGDEGDSENRVQEIGKISRGLKKLAKALNVPVIALSQLSRKCEERPDKKPIASDLRDSGAIEQDADIIIGAWRPGHYWPDQNQNYFQAIVLKNRQGECGPVSLFCDMGQQKFGNWAGDVPDFGQTTRRARTFEG